MLEADWGPSPFPRLHFHGSEAIEGSENIDAWGWQGALPCLSIASVARLSKVREYWCLKLTRGLPLSTNYVWRWGYQRRLENIDIWSWLGAFPFLSIVFGGEAIEGHRIINAWSWLGALPCRLCLVARLSNVGEYWCLKLTGGPPLSVVSIWYQSYPKVEEYRC